MELFGRPLGSYSRGILHAPALIRHAARAAFVFKRPWRLIAEYLLGRSPATNQVVLRDGLEIGLSSHQHDLRTVFVVFARQDYGDIAPGSVILDIGANIGCFSLFAARAGAARVLAFEPCHESYSTLVTNIERNRYAAVIEPHRYAVTERSGAVVQIPRQSSPGNRISHAVSSIPTDDVETISLEDIRRRFAIDNINLLKLDCEGAEYDIVFQAPPSVWPSIEQIRLEYHNGRADELRRYLEQQGYVVTRHSSRLVAGDEHGDLWLARPDHRRT